MRNSTTAIAGILALLLAISASGRAQSPAPPQKAAAGKWASSQQATAGEWNSYGGTNWSQKYAPLDQVTKDNFKDLKVAWTWSSPERSDRGLSL